MNQWPWIAGTLVTVALVVGIVLFDSKANAPTPTTVPPEISTIKDDEWIEGDAAAPVTLIEYSDFQCPACGAFYPMIQKLLKEKAGTVRLVYRQYPLVTAHPNAMNAARAAEAAGLQGKFFEYHDQLFDHQTEWSPEKDPSGRFVDYAKAVGLDVDRFETDRAGEAADNAINDDRQSGDSIGVNSTPTFIVNGERLTQNPQSYDAFVALINDAAAKALEGSDDSSTPENQ